MHGIWYSRVSGTTRRAPCDSSAAASRQERSPGREGLSIVHALLTFTPRGLCVGAGDEDEPGRHSTPLLRLLLRCSSQHVMFGRVRYSEPLCSQGGYAQLRQASPARPGGSRRVQPGGVKSPPHPPPCPTCRPLPLTLCLPNLAARSPTRGGVSPRAFCSRLSRFFFFFAVLFFASSRRTTN